MGGSNSIAMRFVVHGRVQGVGYRAATQRKALALGLHGWVRNLDDGSVEGLAAGSGDALAALHAWLKIGPAQAVVRAVDWQPDATEPPTGFSVLR